MQQDPKKTVPLIDTHVHTKFSTDSSEDPEKLIEHAIALGLKFLAITDHQENEFAPHKWCLDFDAYFAMLKRLQDKYRGQITLAVGVEIGYAPQCDGMALEEVGRYPFDTIINSVHNIEGTDIYYPDFYQGKTKWEAYDKYLSVIEDSVTVDYAYTQVGHIGYITRYAPYADKTLRYPDHAERLDRILKKIIDRAVLLEVNTATKTDARSITPEDILRRYFALGGRLITFASDAHGRNRLCDRYGEVLTLLREIGFNEIHYCLARKIHGMPI